MKLAFITPEYITEPSYSGGLANYLGRVTVALSARGHEVHVFVKSDENTTLDYKGVTVHRVVPLWDLKMRIDRLDRLVPRGAYMPYQDLKAAWCLYRRWKREHAGGPFDVTQVSNVLSVGFFFRLARRKATLVTRLSSFRRLWDTSAGADRTFANKARWWMEKVSIRGIPNTYSPTHFVARLTEEHFKMEGIRVIESPFFVEEKTPDLTLFNAEAKGKRYLLFFGRMTQMKGVHVLVEALKLCLPKHPDMHAFFIGRDGTAPNGKPMSEHIQDALADCSERVHVLESVRHDALYPFIDNARLVVLPSLLDNLPNTCLEAMGHGKVVIATSGTCFEQVITDGVSGFLVEPGKVEPLAGAISSVWTMEPNVLEQVGHQARKSIERLHPDNALDELETYFSQLPNVRS